MASLVPYDLRHEPQQTHIGKTGEVFHLLNLDAYELRRQLDIILGSRYNGSRRDLGGV